MNEHKQYNVRIEGVGNTKEEAMAKALGSIQKKVMNEIKGMIIRIEPLSVEILEAVEHEYTDRFLLFFFPRKRSRFEVKAEVNVNLVTIDLEKISFEKTGESKSSIKQLYSGTHSIR